MDYYSKCIEVAKLDDLTSNNVICHLKSHFARYGVPDELINDDGPQYASSAFKEFSRSYGFLHTMSSPMVKLKVQDPYKALLNYRNTPLNGVGLSPTQIVSHSNSSKATESPRN